MRDSVVGLCVKIMTRPKTVIRMPVTVAKFPGEGVVKTISLAPWYIAAIRMLPLVLLVNQVKITAPRKKLKLNPINSPNPICM